MQTCAPHEKTFTILRKFFRILHKFSVLVSILLVAPSTTECVYKKKKKKKKKKTGDSKITGHYKVLKLIINFSYNQKLTSSNDAIGKH